MRREIDTGDVPSEVDQRLLYARAQAEAARGGVKTAEELIVEWAKGNGAPDRDRLVALSILLDVNEGVESGRWQP